MGTDRKKTTRRRPPTSNAPALSTVRQEVEATRAFVANYQDRVLDLMAGNDADVKRFYQTFSICLAQEPKLAKCSRASLIGALLEIAALKLEPGVLGEAWPIPFKNRRSNQLEATVIIGYKGLLKLSRNTGIIGAIDSDVVYEKDSFDWMKGSEQFIRFKKEDVADRGKMVAAWAQAELWPRPDMVKPSKQFEVMLRREIVKIRDNAPSAKASTSPWKTDEEAMWRKTVLRRLCKTLPSGPESRLARAVGIDELYDARVSQNLASRAPDVSDLPVIEGAVAEEPDEPQGENGEQQPEAQE